MIVLLYQKFISQKLGILALIDEESHFPKGTDESLLKKLHENLAVNFKRLFISMCLKVIFGLMCLK